MTQAMLAAITTTILTFVAVGVLAGLVHRLRHGQGRRYLWGVAVIAVLSGLYQYLNYLGR